MTPSLKSASAFQAQHIYVILFVFTAIAAVLTHFISAGLYDRVMLKKGRVAINPESYRQVEATPVSLEQFMLAIPQGLVDASMVVFFTFIIGGMFMVIRTTGVIDIAVDKLTRRSANRSVLILPLMTALRFDSITAVGVALLVTTAGFSAGVLNPINTGLGQMIAEVQRRTGTLAFYTPGQLRRKLGQLPAGGDEEGMMFAMVHSGADDLLLILQEADRGWRVVGIDR